MMSNGDGGTTSLGNNERVPKNDIRIEVLGNIDELSAVLGLVRAEGLPESLEKSILQIQKTLFPFCSEIALCFAASQSAFFDAEKNTAFLDSQIESLRAKRQSPAEFVIPGANKISALLHHSRTVCRRAERSLVTLSQQESLRPELTAYFNRLSQFLFFLAISVVCNFPHNT